MTRPEAKNPMKHVLLLMVAALSAGALAAQETGPAIMGVRNFSAEDFRAHRQNWAVVQDDRGLLYAGNQDGVLEFDGTRWRLIPVAKGRGAYALAKARDGRILVGGEGAVGFLAPDEAGSLRYVSTSDRLPEAVRSAPGRVLQILETQEGTVFASDRWIGIAGAGGGFTHIQSTDHFLAAALFKGALYVLDSARGLTRLASGSLQEVTGGRELRGLTMLVREDGLLIPTPDEGLVLFVPDAPERSRRLGSGGLDLAAAQHVTCALRLPGGLAAIGTAKGGVVLVDDLGHPKLHVGTADGLEDDHVYGMTYDGKGGLWLALDSGISLVGLRLGKEPGAVPFGAMVRSVEGTRDEKQIFGGAFTDVPGGVPRLEQGRQQILKFPFDYNAFRFSYAANGLEATGSLRFQTYMAGVDAGWSAWSARSDREITQLQAGTWTFQVRARNPHGEISGVGAYSVRILPAWHETAWFVGVQILFVLALLVVPGFIGVGNRFQDVLTTFAILVTFSYVHTTLSPTIGQHSNGVVFFRVIMSASISFLLGPLKKAITKVLGKLHTPKRTETSKPAGGGG